MGERRIAPAKLEAAAAAILARAGARKAEAKTVARYLVRADLVGHSSHGVLRVPTYAQQVKDGDIKPGVTGKVIAEGRSHLVLDADWGWGQVVTERAMKKGIAKAKRAGTAIVAIRNVAHVGRLGDWAEQAAAAGCVALCFVNTPTRPAQAPFGGRERRLSTNPLCCAFPGGKTGPVMIDLTTSAVAEGKVKLAHAAGKSIPLGWIVDKNGKPSTDPGAFYAGGALLPIAAHKGYALATMVDLFAGALSGGPTSNKTTNAMFNNFTAILVSPDAIGTGREYRAQVKRLETWLRSATPSDKKAPVLLPGDVERAMETERRKKGIPIADGVVEELYKAADAYGPGRKKVAALL